MNGVLLTELVACPRCGGCGQIMDIVCFSCDGDGEVTQGYAAQMRVQHREYLERQRKAEEAEAEEAALEDAEFEAEISADVRTLRRVIVVLCLLGLGLIAYAITGNVAASILGAGLGGGQLGDHIA